jgi:carboxymethylenebutenolidase
MMETKSQKSNRETDIKTSGREFCKRTTALAGGSILLCTLPSNLFAEFTKSDDPELLTETIHYAGKSGPMIAYLARPSGNMKHPAVIVIHENRALQPHIKDVARRIALEGFVALAPDALSRLGVTPEQK